MLAVLSPNDPNCLFYMKFLSQYNPWLGYGLGHYRGGSGFRRGLVSHAAPMPPAP